MKKKIGSLLLMCIIAVLLGACGKKTTDVVTKEPVAEETQVAEEPVADSPEEAEVKVIKPETTKEEVVEEPEEESLPVVETKEVVHNGQYFIKVDGKVYFRKYGVNALERLATWGDFLLNPTGEQSTICCYDEKTKELTELGLDFGHGKLVYMDDKLFLTGTDYSQSEYGEPYVYAMDMEGKEITFPAIIHGEIKGVSDDNTLLILDCTYEGAEYHPSLVGLNSDGTNRFRMDSEKPLEYLGMVDAYMIYASMDYGTNDCNTASVICKNIDTGEEVWLGDTTCDSYEGFDFGNIMTINNTYYLPVVIRAGTGYMFQYGSLLKIVPGASGSMEVETDYLAESDDSPYMIMDGKKYFFQDNSADDYYIKRTSYSEDGDLYLRVPGMDDELAVKGFVPGADYYESHCEVTRSECVDNTGYIMRATQVYDEEGSIGWRDGFRLQKMEYICLDGQGGYDIIDTVEYE